MPKLPATPKNVIYSLSCSCHPERGVRYVGQTSKGANDRLSHHVWSANQGLVYPVYAWIRKHSPANVICQVLEAVDRSELLDAAEVKWIETLGTLREQGGLNLWPGGKSVRGYRHAPTAKTRNPGARNYSAETLARISAASASRVGELGGNASISDADATEVKRLSWSGLPAGEVGDQMGIPRHVVHGIASGHTWKHVPWPIGPRVKPRDGRFTSERLAGSKSPTAIFTEDDVREIRRLRAEDGLSHAEIGRRFGTSGTNISFICRRITWKNVE